MVKDMELIKGENAVQLSRDASSSCNTLLQEIVSPTKLVNAILCHFNSPSFMITGTIDGPILVWILRSTASKTIYHLEYWPETNPCRIYLFTNNNPYWAVLQLQQNLGLKRHNLSVIKGGR